MSDRIYFVVFVVFALGFMSVAGVALHRDFTTVYVSAGERIERGDACQSSGVRAVAKPYKQPLLVTCLDGTVEQIDGRREDRR